MYKSKIMFNDTVTKILETIAYTPQTATPMTQGPNINWQGAAPTGFKGDSLSQPNTTKIAIRPKKKKKNIRKLN